MLECKQEKCGGTVSDHNSSMSTSCSGELKILRRQIKFSSKDYLLLNFDMVKDIVGKEENASGQHLLFIPQSFEQPSLSGPLKLIEDCPVETEKKEQKDKTQGETQRERRPIISLNVRVIAGKRILIHIQCLTNIRHHFRRFKD